jgi:5-aminolevulinate synthase
MEALLRQSRGVCPFLKKTSPATLRVLSATPAPAANFSTAAGDAAPAAVGSQQRHHHASPGGGRMSNLQVLARRCPVMGKALAVQSARHRLAGMGGMGGVGKAYHAKAGGASFHSDAQKDAQAVDVGFRPKFAGRSSPRVVARFLLRC